MPEYHPTDNSSVLYENGNYKSVFQIVEMADMNL